MLHRLVILFFVLILSGCEEAVLSGLDELKANKIKVALEREGIEAKKKQHASWLVDCS